MDKLFWNQMTNARRFIEDAVRNLTSKDSPKSIALVLPEDVPWYTLMKELIESKVLEKNAVNSFDIVDCPRENPGDFLLRKYCKTEKRASYRPAIGFAKFFAENDDIVIHNTYIWIRDIPSDLYDSWECFIRDYYDKRAKGKPRALFILEIKDGNVSVQSRKGIYPLKFSDYLKPYDYFTYAALIAANTSTVEDKVKPYLAELSSSICQNNLNICAACVSGGISFLKDPIGYIKEMGYLPLLEDKDETALRRIIWEVQIKHLFPKIENYRSLFLERHYDKVKEVLPILGPFGVNLTQVEDVEIGPLSYMAGSQKIDVSPAEGILLSELKNARDLLAHINVLSYEDARKILYL